MLLCVVDSKGSSPGRTGFKMVVNEQEELLGSIGGGIMEHKLVEQCKADLLKRDFEPFIKRQIHQSDIPKDRSGMICSGEQTIAFYPLDSSHSKLISELVDWGHNGVLTFDQVGIGFDQKESLTQKFHLELTADHWQLKEDLSRFPILHVVGGGHVGLALSQLAFEIGFSIKNYDDRDNLNTMAENRWAERIEVSDYASINDYISAGKDDYVVLMSFGYQTDKILLKELITRDFKYLGMMGSKEKVKKLFAALVDEGVEKERLGSVYAPIGLQIASKTPKEIAISILAEIIQVKNRAEV